ncbi:MAG TPA: neutral/alkaline non-lysosomal ceramidase N-terminal domain-containing protein [Vicinamibacteria bacterium]|nr:neutral/alkaline non-lysosomal ceramidase N-terminal domain-containing protein [Vicinamibacteria bacterium]
MSKRLPCLGSGVLLLVSMPSGLAAAGLKAGAASVEITPPPGVGMYGFANRKGGATGVRDPLMARVLVLEAGEKRLALVAMDLGRPLAVEWTRRLRSHAAETDAIGCVLVTATHTHSGPAIRDEYPPKESPDWESGVLDKVGRAIDEAHARAVDARIGIGYGSVLIGHNRLRLEPDGSITWFERNNTMAPTSPVDPTVAVLRVDGSDGKPLAVLVNYACHPVVFGSDNLRYSADYPGVTVRTVERELGGQPLALFLQGGDGDINPYYAVHPLDQDAERMRDWTGERLGLEAARVAKAVQAVSTADASLDFAEDTLDLQWRWNPARFREAVGQSFGPKAAAAFDRRQAEGLHAPVATVLIDRRIALMTMPGEPFVDHQIDWRNRCPVRDTLFLGYSNDSLGYFPTIRAASLGGYGAANAATYVQPDAGARIVDHALVRVYEMLGRLRDTPEDAKPR